MKGRRPNLLQFEWHRNRAGYLVIDGPTGRELMDGDWAGAGSGYAAAPAGQEALATKVRRLHECGMDLASISGELREPIAAITPMVWSAPISEGFERYNIDSFDEPIWRVFASTSPDEKAIVEFANNYGPLGISGEAALPDVPAGRALCVPLQTVAHNVRLRKPETISAWVHQINRMHEVSALWHSLTSDDREYLGDVFPVRGQGARYTGPRGLSFGLDHLDAPSASGSNTDLRVLARRALAKLLDGAPATPASRLTFVDGPKGAVPVQVLRPDSLADALLLQATTSICGNLRTVACEECGKWMPISTEGRRGHSKYCSSAHRQQAYRRRRDGGQGCTTRTPSSAHRDCGMIGGRPEAAANLSD